MRQRRWGNRAAYMSSSQDGGVAEVVCSPLGWWCVRGGMLNTLLFSQVLLFAAGSLQVAVGFFFSLFWSLFIFVWSWPHCTSTKLFWGPMQFPCILFLEETCVHVQALQQRVSGPSLFHNQEGVTNKQGPAAKRKQAEKVDRGEGAGRHLPI